MAALFFNVPTMASQAGAATPLVFLLSAAGMLGLGVSIVFFARRLSSAGGFVTWIRHGLGKGAAFQAGWLMLGSYALFEAASQAAFGGLTDLTVSTALGWHIPGGWVMYALLSILLVGVLSVCDVRWSVWVLAPFALLEIGSLLLLDFAITLHGGAAGHDLWHTFTPAGTALPGVAPGGVLGIGVAMALGVWSYVGFETGAAYGEEARQPHRAIPIGIGTVLVLMVVLYVWTTYSATIGLGWQHAGDVLGNIAQAPEPYYHLAETSVGHWLVTVMIVTVSTSTFASCLAFHNGMVRYAYTLGREGILPFWLGATHPRWKSPRNASVVQTLFTVLVILLLGLVIQTTHTDGSVSYALGIADGTVFHQTSGIASYAWLAIIGTINLLIVYLLTNIAAPVYAWRTEPRGAGMVVRLLAPVGSSLILLIPLVSFVMPAIPGAVGGFFTTLGFVPTPFPLNSLPLFVVLWVSTGLVYALVLARRHPERYARVGRVLPGEDE